MAKLLTCGVDLVQRTSSSRPCGTLCEVVERPRHDQRYKVVIYLGGLSYKMSKLVYLQRSISRQFAKSRFLCPNCGGNKSDIIERKFLVTQLRRCADCKLMFRTPTDDPATNASFYESEYTQGFTTDMPSDAELARLKGSSFAGTEKDYAYYIDVLRQLGIWKLSTRERGT
jgi:hypothetical protein